MAKGKCHGRKLPTAVAFPNVPVVNTATLERGNTVRLRAFGGKLLERKVVDVRGSVVLVTSARELQLASDEGREPESLGWAADDVIEVIPDA